MLAWFVHQYVEANQLTPATVLVMFIVSVIALAWAVFTTIDYLRARHDAFFVALFDLGLVGALIAGVYYLRGPGTTDCNNFSAGIAGTVVYLNLNINKTCTMLKASFALGIIAIIAFFVTFVSWKLDGLSCTMQLCSRLTLYPSSLHSWSIAITGMTTVPSSSGNTALLAMVAVTGHGRETTGPPETTATIPVHEAVAGAITARGGSTTYKEHDSQRGLLSNQAHMYIWIPWK